jgi:hypothetical protein
MYAIEYSNLAAAVTLKTHWSKQSFFFSEICSILCPCDLQQQQQQQQQMRTDLGWKKIRFNFLFCHEKPPMGPSHLLA